MKPDRRPRLLFLAYFFPPATASGCVRTWNVAKYLTRLGWDVTVVTPDPSVWRHAENIEATDARLKRENVRRILTGHRWRYLSPNSLNCWNGNLGWVVSGICRQVIRHLGIDQKIGWIKAAEQACSTLTAKDVDIILASGLPFVAFTLAKRLSDRLGRPYILDYRDPWTGNPHHRKAYRPAIVQEEARLLANCAAVTIVSPSWGEALHQSFGLGSKLHVITNGYDPEELLDVRPYKFGHFAIVYAGTFYPPKRVISPVMAALKRLKETLNGKGSDWHFHYYGDKGNHVREEARRFEVVDRVVLHGRVPRAEALSAIRGAAVTVVITSVGEEETLADKGIVTAKVFDAIGLGTPILLIAPPGSDTETIAQTTGLAQSFTGNEIDGMTVFLQEAISHQTCEPKNLDVYAWPHLAQRFDRVLRGAVANTTSNRNESLPWVSQCRE